MIETEEQDEAAGGTPSSRAMGIRLSAEERRLLEQLVELAERRVYEASGVRLRLTMTAVLRTLVLKEAEREGLLRPGGAWAEREERSAPEATAGSAAASGAEQPPKAAAERRGATAPRVKQLLRAALEEGRWNQSRLAEASGVSRQRIGAFWRGQRTLEPGEREALARVLDAVPG